MLYFAYGSNMSTPRLRSRVPSAMPVHVAELPGYRLAFHKVGMDGSAKCDAFRTGKAGDAVSGVLFRIDADAIPMLDAFEGLGVGYERREVRVVARSGGTLHVFTYCATLIDDSLRPFDWYRRHVLHGAAEHGLPEDYIRRIAAVEVVADPDAARSAREAAIYG